MSEIEERLAQVRARIAEAERRSPYGQEVTLVAVTKFHPLEDMEEAIRLGGGREPSAGNGREEKVSVSSCRLEFTGTFAKEQSKKSRSLCGSHPVL